MVRLLVSLLFGWLMVTSSVASSALRTPLDDATDSLLDRVYGNAGDKLVAVTSQILKLASKSLDEYLAKIDEFIALELDRAGNAFTCARFKTVAEMKSAADDLAAKFNPFADARPGFPRPRADYRKFIQAYQQTIEASTEAGTIRAVYADLNEYGFLLQCQKKDQDIEAERVSISRMLAEYRIILGDDASSYPCRTVQECADMRLAYIRGYLEAAHPSDLKASKAKVLLDGASPKPSQPNNRTRLFPTFDRRAIESSLLTYRKVERAVELEKSKRKDRAQSLLLKAKADGDRALGQAYGNFKNVCRVRAGTENKNAMDRLREIADRADGARQIAAAAKATDFELGSEVDAYLDKWQETDRLLGYIREVASANLSAMRAGRPAPRSYPTVVCPEF